MGKKLQGAKLRSKQRQKKQLEELQERQAEQVAQQSSADKTNDELFVLDTSGDAVPKAQRPSLNKNKKSKKKKETKWSAAEKAAIDKLQKRHSPEQLAALAKEGRRVLDKSNHLRTHGIRKAKNSGSVRFDLWDEQESDEKNQKERNTHPPDDTTVAKPSDGNDKGEENKSNNTTRAGGTSQPLVGKSASKSTKVIPSRNVKAKGVAVDVPMAGQSYRPDPQQHQKVLQEAMKVEERRNQAEVEKKAPISPGMRPETKALILGDSDSSDDEEDEEETNAGGTEDLGTSAFHKQKDKLTRAQRNKQKRVRREEKERLEAKKKRKMDSSFYQLPRFKKEIRQEEDKQKERQLAKQQRATEEQESKEKAGSNVEQSLSEQDPLTAPLVPVALSSELGGGVMSSKDKSKGSSNSNAGGLRTIRPKGDLVTDRMASFALRNLAPRLPAQAAAHKAKVLAKKRRSKIKVKGAKQWQGEDFVIIK